MEVVKERLSTFVFLRWVFRELCVLVVDFQIEMRIFAGGRFFVYKPD